MDLLEARRFLEYLYASKANYEPPDEQCEQVARMFDLVNLEDAKNATDALLRDPDLKGLPTLGAIYLRAKQLAGGHRSAIDPEEFWGAIDAKEIFENCVPVFTFDDAYRNRFTFEYVNKKFARRTGGRVSFLGRAYPLYKKINMPVF